VERDVAWASRSRRLDKDYERLPGTVAVMCVGSMHDKRVLGCIGQPGFDD
jgi:hypothetical protein